MTVALVILAILSALELLLYVPPLWQMRRVLAAGLLMGLTWSYGIFFVDHAALASGLVVLVGMYRLFNLLRLVEGRMHERYLKRVALRSTISLIALQLIILASWAAANTIGFTSYRGWLSLAIGQLLLATGLVMLTKRNTRSSRAADVSTHVPDHELPSITVCIPARNETLALESCLRALIASDYPKLEILVLDDQSHDRTPDIIRSFAHDGVRFIKGNEPPADWLAKNWAYQRLSEEASGEFLVFAGVDVRFEPGTLRALITSMIQDTIQMVGLIPINTDRDENQHIQSVLLQPIRYGWELCLPRWLLHRPPVLSTCWVASKQLLKAGGGFRAVTRAITPESHFATEALAQGKYRFWLADNELQIKSFKQSKDQWDTALRTRYPQLHRRPELVLLLSLAELVIFVLPFGVAIVALRNQSWLLSCIAALASFLLTYVFTTLVRLTFRHFILRSLVALPAAILVDVYIRHRSMWAYEFGQVLWKDRDVSAPVMHVTPHLPPLA